MSDALKQALEDWQRAGLTDLPPNTEPLEFSTAPASDPEPASSAPVAAESTPAPGPTAAATPAAEQSQTEQPPREQPATEIAAEKKLELLDAQVKQCQRCRELADTRTQTVFGVGDPNATVMFIGEAPGADEDRLGEPFVGRAGQLLDDIVTKGCGWRREDLYICNILRCRPPGNRNPTDSEAANCREYLDGQIDAVQPDWIICWGSVAAKNLLNVDKSIGKMRKQLFEYKSAQVLCTYHPSYLLRNPSAKKDVWDDLQFLFGHMGYTPPSLRK